MKVIGIALLCAAAALSQSRAPRPGTQATPNNAYGEGPDETPGFVGIVTTNFCYTDVDTRQCIAPAVGCHEDFNAYVTANSGEHVHESLSAGTIYTPGRAQPKILLTNKVSDAAGNLSTRWALPQVAGNYTWEGLNAWCPDIFAPPEARCVGMCNGEGTGVIPVNNSGENVFAAFVQEGYYENRRGTFNPGAIPGEDPGHNDRYLSFEPTAAKQIDAASIVYYYTTRQSRIAVAGMQFEPDKILPIRGSIFYGGIADNIKTRDLITGEINFNQFQDYATYTWGIGPDENHPIGEEVDVVNPYKSFLPLVNWYETAYILYEIAGCQIGNRPIGLAPFTKMTLSEAYRYWTNQPIVHFNCGAPHFDSYRIPH